MSVAIVTGSAGLIGSEVTRALAARGLFVVGIDNDMRSRFFGPEASTTWQRQRLEQELGTAYRHCDLDIRDADRVQQLLRYYGQQITAIVHTAAQPSHDWAASDPQTDFATNANGTLNMLQATRDHCPDATFLFTSTNKVYGDRPNSLPLVETETRWEIAADHPYANGIPESMSIDQSLHSLFGVSKVAADLLVQEYGRYFGLKTTCFRGGCLTGPNHSGTQLHGFLAYLVKCCATGTPYRVFGYQGKQVRDNIHSHDLVAAFLACLDQPRCGEVYNMGGGRHSNCSMLEAIEMTQEITGRQLEWTYEETNRVGDHIWWISDLSKFQSHYPNWRMTYDVRDILTQIYAANVERWNQGVPA
jgi:CDP-paratose 2-epimerase